MAGIRCKVCGKPARMGKARKPKLNPTKAKENNAYCPLCGWSDKKAKEAKKKE